MNVHSWYRRHQAEKDHQREVIADAVRSGRRSLMVALAIVVLAMLWVASGLLTGESNGDAKPIAAPAADATEAVTVRVMPSVAEPRTDELSIKGRTEAFRKVNVRAETSGRIIEIGAEKGDRVEKGALLVRLDAGDRTARVGEAEALVRQRELEYNAARELGKSSFASQIKVSTAKAQLDAAQALLIQARRELARTTIRSPYAGTLADRPLEVGDYLTIGGPVATVVDLNPLKITANVTEQDVDALVAGKPARAILVDGREVEGVIDFVGKVADPMTRTFPVEVLVANPGDAIQDGLTAEVLLPLRTAPAHHISPAMLSLSDAGEIGVKTVDEAGVVHFRPVSIVEDTIDGMWVAGLPERVTLITVGHEFVSDGQTVTPVREDTIAD